MSQLIQVLPQTHLLVAVPVRSCVCERVRERGRDNRHSAGWGWGREKESAQWEIILKATTIFIENQGVYLIYPSYKMIWTHI